MYLISGDQTNWIKGALEKFLDVRTQIEMNSDAQSIKK